MWPACQQIGWEGCSHGLNFSAFVLGIEEFTTYTRNTVILGELASHWELLPSDNKKRWCLSLPLLWFCDAYVSSWGVALLATCPLPYPYFPDLLWSLYTLSLLLPAWAATGGAIENPNSPFGTWEPHTSFFWWFLLCFVLFKRYEDNTSSAGPREEWHQTLPLQANAHWFSSLQQGQSFSKLQLGGHGRYD